MPKVGKLRDCIMSSRIQVHSFCCANLSNLVTHVCKMVAAFCGSGITFLYFQYHKSFFCEQLSLSQDIYYYISLGREMELPWLAQTNVSVSPETGESTSLKHWATKQQNKIGIWIVKHKKRSNNNKTVILFLKKGPGPAQYLYLYGYA